MVGCKDVFVFLSLLTITVQPVCGAMVFGKAPSDIFTIIQDDCKTAWGIDEIKKINHNICSVNDFTWCIKGCEPKKRRYVWMAYKITNHGAYFCPISMGNPVFNVIDNLTLYKISDECHWVCKDGYGGDECAQENGGVRIDDTIKNENVTFKPSADLIPFHQSNRVQVFSYATRDYMPLLGTPTSDGHGIFAKILSVGVDTSSGIEITPNEICEPLSQFDNTFVLCKSGYQAEDPNATDAESAKCVPIDDAIVAECAPTPLSGPDPKTGKCITCEIGQIFNQTVGKCVTASKLSKTDMLYGYGKNRTSDDDITKQCWTMYEPDKYRECVLNGVK